MVENSTMFSPNVVNGKFLMLTNKKRYDKHETQFSEDNKPCYIKTKKDKIILIETSFFRGIKHV